MNKPNSGSQAAVDEIRTSDQTKSSDLKSLEDGFFSKLDQIESDLQLAKKRIGYNWRAELETIALSERDLQKRLQKLVQACAKELRITQVVQFGAVASSNVEPSVPVDSRTSANQVNEAQVAEEDFCILHYSPPKPYTFNPVRIRQLAAQALQAMRPVAFSNEVLDRDGESSQHHLLIVPLTLRPVHSLEESITPVIAAYYPSDSEYADSIREAILVIPVVLAIAEKYFVNQELDNHVTLSAAVIELIENISAADNFPVACHQVIDQLQKFLNCEWIAIGQTSSGKVPCKIVGLVEPPGDEPVKALANRITSLMDEVVVRGIRSVWPIVSGENPAGMLGPQRLSTELNAALIITTPLRDSQGRIFAALFLGCRKPATANLIRRFIELAEAPMQGALSLQHRSRPSGIIAWTSKVWSWGKSQKVRLAVLVGVTLTVFSTIPLPSWVRCSCEIQPVSRRFVAAPFDGTLASAFVEPGDLVAENEILAKLEGREIRWEIASLEAEIQGIRKRRDEFNAAHEFGDAQLASYELERLTNQIAILQDRNEHLDIRSPIAGLVVTGDQKKSEGVALKIGQSLFEIAPLDQMLVEVAVSEDDIALVKDNAEVTIRLNGAPGRVWKSNVTRLHPRSELKNDENVFIAEVRLDNSDNRLRPGMKGAARIECENRSVMARVLAKPWERFLFFMGW